MSCARIRGVRADNCTNEVDALDATLTATTTRGKLEIGSASKGTGSAVSNVKEKEETTKENGSVYAVSQNWITSGEYCLRCQATSTPAPAVRRTKPSHKVGNSFVDGPTTMQFKTRIMNTIVVTATLSRSVCVFGHELNLDPRYSRTIMHPGQKRRTG